MEMGNSAEPLQALAALFETTVGTLPPTGLQLIPFGESTMEELICAQAERAFAQKQAGAKLLLTDDLSSTAEVRAAALGGRQTGLPVCVMVETDDEGLTLEGCGLLACIAAAQHLGIAAAGVHCRDNPAQVLAQVTNIIPYLTVPLVVRLDAVGCGEEGAFSCSPEDFYQAAVQLYRAGAGLLLPGAGVTSAHIDALNRAMEETSDSGCTVPRDGETLLMASSTRAFFLSQENLQFSQELFCRYDMSEEILAAEEGGCDVLYVHVDTPEDVENLAANVHMMQELPLCISSHSEELLEAALIAYNGRAFVDTLTEMEDSTLAALAKGYGAVVL